MSEFWTHKVLSVPFSGGFEKLQILPEYECCLKGNFPPTPLFGQCDEYLTWEDNEIMIQKGTPRKL